MPSLNRIHDCLRFKANKNYIYNKRFILFFITIVTACQTIPTKDTRKSKTEVLNSQKTIIVEMLNKGAPGLANKELRKLLKHNQGDADFLNLMGLTQLAMGNPTRAIHFFQKAIRIDPKISTQLNLSSAWIEAGKTQKAIKKLKDIQKMNSFHSYPHHERVYHNLAFCYERNGKYKAAERQYKRALLENPNNYISMMRLGQVYETMKKNHLARKKFNQARNACSICFDPVNALTQNYLRHGKKRKAINFLRKYLKIKQINQEDKIRAKRLLRTAMRKGSANRRQKNNSF